MGLFMKRKFVNLFAVILLAILVSGCTKARTIVSDGSVYRDKKLGVELSPPAGWEIFTMKNALIDGVAFYPQDRGNVRVYITSKTIITDFLGFGGRSEMTQSLADHIRKNRAKRKRQPECRILRDKSGKINSYPAHVIEAAYMYEDRIPAEDKCFLFKYNDRYYVVGYWVFRDKDYDRNIAELNELLGTFKLSS